MKKYYIKVGKEIIVSLLFGYKISLADILEAREYLTLLGISVNDEDIRIVKYNGVPENRRYGMEFNYNDNVACLIENKFELGELGNFLSDN